MKKMSIFKDYSIKICFFLIIFLNYACDSLKPKIDPVTGKPIVVEPNVEQRARDYADKNPIFTLGGNKKDSTLEFATSNVLWRATLDILEFMPLNSIDYAGGIIATDWYSGSETKNEKIKISVRFLNNEVKTSSIKISAFKETCAENRCRTIQVSENFNNEIKELILNKARELKIQEFKKTN